jgi:hypothetical protein
MGTYTWSNAWLNESPRTEEGGHENGGSWKKLVASRKRMIRRSYPAVRKGLSPKGPGAELREGPREGHPARGAIGRAKVE